MVGLQEKLVFLTPGFVDDSFEGVCPVAGGGVLGVVDQFASDHSRVLRTSRFSSNSKAK